MKNITVSAAPHPQQKDITLLTVKGFIDTTTAPEFDKTFQSVLNENRFKLVIDLKDVDYVSSAGWGLFVGEIKRIRGQKGDLFLASMSPAVEEAYDLLQFNTIIKSFPNAEQAVQNGFGRARAGKAPVGAKPAKAAPDQLPEEPVPAAAPVEKSPVDSPIAPSPRKPGMLSRLFKPWTWF
jgi:anti-sigma B factor antagonist